MKKCKLQRVVPFLLISSMLLTGCGKKSDCNLPTRHVHVYYKNITGTVTIYTYYDDEHLERNGYTWQPEMLEITKTDEDMYKLLNSKNLFDGYNNFNYLYYEMANNHDYLKFYYEYETTETYTTTDSKGNVEVHTRTVHHDGWHTNPNDSDNTGKTRVYHHKYYGYRVLYQDGKFVLDRSPLVDDVREILEEYPYVCEKGYEEVYETFKFSRSELPYLSPDDFTCFDHPNLDNTSPTLNQGYSK